ncbi:MAG: alpha-amlyase [Cellulomonas sp. 73-145]|uniref:alpha-amylase n=1 Tax=Cellulomonas sp. 73-145 TaxID=1895739 RepID=UPI00092800F9|nr:alpha-amylase family protein [Cellulomonas sp. 73-145]OJV58340.1 MAG: alpha-amlyase [Cellulomonas sp. 73-145]
MTHRTTPFARSRRLLRTATLAALLALLAACSTPGRSASTTAAPAVRDVGVQLFQWTWPAIGRECTDRLGPAGYGWVLTSPPQEHVLGSQWWTSYQPVSYRLESRLGTREQLAAMVTACHAAGVKVYTDAVVNHMTGQDAPGVGWAGSSYSHYDYPGLYSDAAGDFHHCGLTPGDDIVSYQDATQVRTCQLSNLADLATEKPQVRQKIAAYLADLVSLGVDGFRIDAAKHMAPEDIAAFTASLPAGTGVVQEVIRGSGEPITPEQYLANGKVLEFSWGRDVKGMLAGSIGPVLALGTGGRYAPSDKAVVFVDNHDTERNRSTLSYRDGATYQLADVLMLAGTYGTPLVYSGYAFDDRDAGPRQDARGAVLDAACGAAPGPGAALQPRDWVCQHAWPAVAGMVGWRAVAGSAAVADRWSEGDAVALGRGGLGFVVVNNGDSPVATSIPTHLPAGTYCDVLAGGAPVSGGRCTGSSATVKGGEIAVQVAPHSAQAWDVSARRG